MKEDKFPYLQELEQQNIELAESNETLEKQNTALKKRVEEMTVTYHQALDALNAAQGKIPWPYKVGIGLVILGVVAFVGSIVLYASSPSETYEASVCAKTCAEYLAERTATVWAYYPTIIGALIALVAGLAVVIVKAAIDST